LEGWNIPKYLKSFLMDALETMSNATHINACRVANRATSAIGNDAMQNEWRAASRSYPAGDQACVKVGGPRGAAASKTRVMCALRVGGAASVLASCHIGSGGCQDVPARVGLCPSKPQ
jgi:hypothetical protein